MSNLRAKLFLINTIKPVLKEMGLFSPSASKLLLGTAIQESSLIHRKQIEGRALSYFQIEPDTHDDLWKNYLAYRPELAAKVSQFLSETEKNEKLRALKDNDRYAAAMARIYYYRLPEALPPFDDLAKMAEFWKVHYNTGGGDGESYQFIDNWNYMAAYLTYEDFQ